MLKNYKIKLTTKKMERKKVLIKCSKNVAKEWEKWIDKLSEKKLCVRLKCNNLLKNFVENYIENLVKKVMSKVLLKNCVEELGGKIV